MHAEVARFLDLATISRIIFEPVRICAYAAIFRSGALRRRSLPFMVDGYKCAYISSFCAVHFDDLYLQFMQRAISEHVDEFACAQFVLSCDFNSSTAVHQVTSSRNSQHSAQYRTLPCTTPLHYVP